MCFNFASFLLFLDSKFFFLLRHVKSDSEERSCGEWLHLIDFLTFCTREMVFVTPIMAHLLSCAASPREQIFFFSTCLAIASLGNVNNPLNVCIVVGSCVCCAFWP